MRGGSPKACWFIVPPAGECFGMRRTFREHRERLAAVAIVAYKPGSSVPAADGRPGARWWHVKLYLPGGSHGTYAPPAGDKRL